MVATVRTTEMFKIYIYVSDDVSTESGSGIGNFLFNREFNIKGQIISSRGTV